MIMKRCCALVAACAVGGAAAQTLHDSKNCDILVAGGSLASLAAAVTIANVSSTLSVCFTEITDWPGGQMTASGVPAIDFGTDNKIESNLPGGFNKLLFGPLMPGGTNLGDCWVSTKCFQPQIVMEAWIMPLIASFPNLVYFPRTAVLSAARDPQSSAVTSVSAVQRTPAASTTGWEALLSQQLSDWYDPAPSAVYPQKTLWNITAKVVIEATEFGDVLATSGVGFAQGIEAPYENSTSYIDFCGQAATIPLTISYGREPAPSPDPVPPGSAEGEPWGTQGKSWVQAWTYRRSLAVNHSGINSVVQGEISNQNIGNGNDFVNGYIFLPTSSPEFQAQLAPGAWRGGVNLTTMARAEQRAFGYYHYYRTNSSIPGIEKYLSLNVTQAGTVHGLSKMPYLRDTRRAKAGLGGYRLTVDDLRKPDPAHNRTAQKWPDTVGIGQYFYADIHKMDAKTCPYPSYITSGSPVLPYFLPFRSLTVEGAPNLLVAGKSLAQTFYANAATRLHPEEWTTGAAAGAAAVLMVQHGWTTSDVLNNIAQLQSLVKTPPVGLPLDWTLKGQQ